MPACCEIRVHGPEQSSELLLGRRGEEERLVRAGSRVEREQLSSVAELDASRERPGLDRRRAGVGQTVSRPVSNRELRLGYLLGRALGGSRIEDERIGVPEDDRPGPPSDLRETLHRLSTPLEHVAEADHSLDPLPVKLGDDRIERHRVPVRIRDERGAHVRGRPGRERHCVQEE